MISNSRISDPISGRVRGGSAAGFALAMLVFASLLFAGAAAVLPARANAAYPAPIGYLCDVAQIVEGLRGRILNWDGSACMHA